MDALFFISIACFFALFVAALAIARHVRVEGFGRADYAEPSPRSALDWPERQDRPAIEHRSTEQSLRNLTEHKEPDWRFLISEDRRNPVSATRKPPASVRTHQQQRPDWAYFNRDLGDLSDPYQPSTTRAAQRDGRRVLLSLPRKEAS